MMNKTLLLDFDGVISPGKYFSEIYSEKFGVSLDRMLPFFDTMKNTANTGKADLKELLVDVLNDWKWDKSVDELLEFWFNSDSDIDERVKEIAQNLREEGWKIYLATDQEKYRTEFIWNERGLKDWLDGRFVSFEVGHVKADPDFFVKVSKELSLDPSEIIFFDDSQSKVDSAKSVGIDAYLYENIQDLQKIKDK